MVTSSIAFEAKAQDQEEFGLSSTELDFTCRKAIFKELHGSKPDSSIIATGKVDDIGVELFLQWIFFRSNSKFKLYYLVPLPRNPQRSFSRLSSYISQTGTSTHS